MSISLPLPISCSHYLLRVAVSSSKVTCLRGDICLQNALLFGFGGYPFWIDFSLTSFKFGLGALKCFFIRGLLVPLPVNISAATLQKCGVKSFFVFLCQSLKVSWNCGDIFRMVCFPGFGCPNRNMSLKFHAKNRAKNGKFHTNFTLLGRGAELI